MKVGFFKKRSGDIYKIEYCGKIQTVKSNLKSDLQAHNCEKCRLMKITIEAI